MEKFYTLFCLLILFSTVMTITSLNPIHSIFWLVVTFIQSSFILLSLEFDFIGIILIIIYVGAIAILFLFVIMMLDVLQIFSNFKIFHLFPILIIVSTVMFLDFNILFFTSKSASVFTWRFDYFSQLELLGKIFYSDYLLPLILISILLLIAMIAAIILTLDISSITKRQSLINQHQRNNSWN